MKDLSSLERKLKFYNFNIDKEQDSFSITLGKINKIPILITIILSLLAIIFLVFLFGLNTIGVISLVAGLSVITYSARSLQEISVGQKRRLTLVDDKLLYTTRTGKEVEIAATDIEKFTSTRSTNPQNPKSSIEVRTKDGSEQTILDVFFKTPKYLNEGSQEIAVMLGNLYSPSSKVD